MSLPTAWTRAALVVIALTTVGACAKSPPKTPTATPTALNVPEPPPRYVVPVSLQPTEPPPPIVEPEPAAPPKPTAPPPSTSKPDRTPPPQPPPPPTTADPPPPVLQTTRDTRELEAQARRDLERAKTMLDRIVPERLTADARATYNQARGFINQADTSLKENNFISAADYAKKAATLAEALAKATGVAGGPDAVSPSASSSLPTD